MLKRNAAASGRRGILLIVALAALGGCATPPPGPTVSVLPSAGMPFDRFAEEDAFCREYTRDQTIGAPEQANATPYPYP